MTPVVVERSFVVVAPYAAGGHRGIDLRTRAGAAVRAPCGGRVTFRGRVAGSAPLITIDCGTLRATIGRTAASVGVGGLVGRGDVIGQATGTRLDLSARHPDGSYRDPAGLIGLGTERPPVGLARRGPRWRSTRDSGATRTAPAALEATGPRARSAVEATGSRARHAGEPVGRPASIGAAAFIGPARSADVTGTAASAGPVDESPADRTLVAGSALATLLAVAAGLIGARRRQARRVGRTNDRDAAGDVQPRRGAQVA